MSDIIYHYTDIHACQSMIENKQFWLSAHSFLNDETEYFEGFKAFKKMLDEKLKGVPPASQLRAQELISYIEKIMIYSTSFSKESDLLSQWRSYCPKEGGVAIGFDREALSRSQRIQLGKLNSRYLEDCCYDKTQTKFDAATLADAIHMHLCSGDSNDRERFLQHTFFLELMTFLGRTKNPHFREEQEVRLFSYGDRGLEQLVIEATSSMPSIPLVQPEEVSFRPKQNFLVPYLKVDFPIEAIKQINIGPSNFTKECEESLTMFMKAKGLNIDITKSEIPYRAI
ncbi:hypothetical protein VIN01S_00870 [Vibrio inusitatus NBRC 102082]|uniref:DUF2971 domain-containing protein n=1 Tax=Vibrio inusitatus NBRC 102082 TaxID=1219070 RepID=A0A4Y3HQ56_9VIBR|nr:DUF2971 domain-containing protein [Vibrio inusitatus]GEA49283.1 hypothetical protein VIN01S_00870 [Vibrio inusitatus NBRC 102082]